MVLTWGPTFRPSPGCIAGHSSFCTERAGLPSLEQWSPTFLAPETDLVEDSFSTDQNQRDDFGIISTKYIYYCTFFFSIIITSRSILDHQALIRSWRLGTPAFSFTPTHRWVAVFVLHKGILNNTGHFGKNLKNWWCGPHHYIMGCGATGPYSVPYSHHQPSQHLLMPRVVRLSKRQTPSLSIA